MILDTTTKSLELVLGSVATTANMPVVVDYVDNTSTTFAPGSVDTQSNGATPVTILAAPGSGVQRKVNALTLFNADTAAKVATIRLNNNATLRTIYSVTLQVGDTLGYTDITGWYVQDSSGSRKGTGPTGSTGATGLTGAFVVGADGLDGDEGMTIPGPKGDTGTSIEPHRNLVINGAFDIAQRNTTYAVTTTFAYGCVDRWGFTQATTAACTASQVAIATSGIPFRYGLKLQRTNGATTTGVITSATAFETTDSVKFAGKQVTLSFYAKAGANYSASGSILNFHVHTGTGIDEAANNVGGWTGAATPLSVAQVITTTLTKYTVTGTIAAGATQIAISAIWTPVGTAGADDSVTITGVQLEVGATATDFEFRSVQDELAMCQRYYETTYPAGVFPGTANTSGPWVGVWINTTDFYDFGRFHWKVTKRASPTVAVYSTLDGAVGYFSNQAATNSASSAQYIGTQGCRFNSSSSGTIGNYAGGHITISAEL